MSVSLTSHLLSHRTTPSGLCGPPGIPSQCWSEVQRMVEAGQEFVASLWIGQHEVIPLAPFWHDERPDKGLVLFRAAHARTCQHARTWPNDLLQRRAARETCEALLHGLRPVRCKGWLGNVHYGWTMRSMRTAPPTTSSMVSLKPCISDIPNKGSASTASTRI